MPLYSAAKMRWSLFGLFVLFGLSSGTTSEDVDSGDEELPEGKMFGFGGFGGHRGPPGFNQFGGGQHRFGGRPGPQFGGQPGNQFGSPGNQFGPPGNQFGGPPGNQFGSQGNQFRPPGNRFGGQPGNQFGGQPGNQFGGQPGNQFGGQPGNQFGGSSHQENPVEEEPTSSQFGGGPPSSQFGGGPPGSQFGGGQPGFQFGGGPHSQFGGPPPQFGGPTGSQFGGPPGSHFGGPPGSQFGPFGNEDEDMIDLDEADHVHVDLNLLVNNVIVFLRPVLTQAIKGELAKQGVNVLPPFPGHSPFPGHNPFPFPGGPPPPFWQHQDDHEDLDEFLGEGPPGQFGGGPYGMYGEDPSMFRSFGEDSEDESNEEGGDDTTSSSCKTLDGPMVGKACIFPFGHNGKQYNTCASEDAEGDTSPWCSTKVDASGNHVSGEGEYGSCDPDNAECATKPTYVIDK